MSEELGFTTRALNASSNAEEVGQSPLSAPIYQTATFAFEDMDDFAAVSETKISGGYLYSRWANPTVDALGRTVAAMEGADAAACYASGMGAISGALTALLSEGDHVVSSTALYGGTFGVMSKKLPRRGVAVSMVDVADLDAVKQAMRPETKVVYAETIGNPNLPVADVDALAGLAHEHGALLVVDATFTPPCLLRALDHGADLVVHSATKYLGGHHDVTAGVASGSAGLVGRLRMAGIEDGAILAPMEAWLTLRGTQTLALRVERICASALALARRFEDHGAVNRVWYPGLESHPHHDLARRLLSGGFGGMVCVDLAGGLEAGRRTMERLRIAKPAASLGGVHTLVVHPATVTHTQLDRVERERAGITDGMLRISVGIEDTADLVADFEQALT
jgi:methionine-gamma-lyase